MYLAGKAPDRSAALAYGRRVVVGILLSDRKTSTSHRGTACPATPCAPRRPRCSARGVRCRSSPIRRRIYDLDEAIRLNTESDETSRRIWPWPEPRGHSLWKLGVAHLYRGDHGSAERAFREAEALRELDIWGRWTWEISLWRSRGELSLAEEKYDEAWAWALRSLKAATQCRQRKHEARARRLQGQILAAQGRLEDGGRALTVSLD